MLHAQVSFAHVSIKKDGPCARKPIQSKTQPTWPAGQWARGCQRQTSQMSRIACTRHPDAFSSSPNPNSNLDESSLSGSQSMRSCSATCRLLSKNLMSRVGPRFGGSTPRPFVSMRAIGNLELDSAWSKLARPRVSGCRHDLDFTCPNVKGQAAHHFVFRTLEVLKPPHALEPDQSTEARLGQLGDRAPRAHRQTGQRSRCQADVSRERMVMRMRSKMKTGICP